METFLTKSKLRFDTDQVSLVLGGWCQVVVAAYLLLELCDT